MTAGHTNTSEATLILVFPNFQIPDIPILILFFQTILPAVQIQQRHSFYPHGCAVFQKEHKFWKSQIEQRKHEGLI